ncbi:hypothetical protein ACQ4LE_008191 [Meloidogyne hapla]|uniref:G_PROTEIN_RECEP_F1_2 domain-containing protein n=1 Tax=Meloidogyne hapla TaxID=6305 RepID=A0A1I8BZ40_MELHA
MHLYLFSTFLIACLVSSAYSHSVLQGDDTVHIEHAEPEAKGLERLLTRTKRSNGRWTAQQVIECIFAIFLPPVAIIIHGGREWVLHFIINIVLTIIGWIPGVIHALWYCFFS